MKPTVLFSKSALAASFGASLVLAACNQAPSAQQAPPPTAALPLTTAAAPPIADAPPATQLPPAPPAPVARVRDSKDRYAYLDQASSVGYGLGQAPPDYTFDYGGDRPWVWRSDNNYTQVVEPLAGGNRYYYYRPGDNYPFLVRDADYSYGYDNGALVIVYDRSGHVLPDDYVRQRADLAGRYLARARSLYEASQQSQHQAVALANWQARQSDLAAERDRWRQDEARDSDWSSYHEQHQDQDEAQWDQERYRRQAEAARTAQLLNDTAAAALLWQSAQQAQSHTRGRDQNGGGQDGGGFGRQDQRPSAAQGQGPEPQQGPPPMATPQGQDRQPAAAGHFAGPNGGQDRGAERRQPDVPPSPSQPSPQDAAAHNSAPVRRDQGPAPQDRRLEARPPVATRPQSPPSPRPAPRAPEARPPEPRPSEPRPSEPRPSEPRPVESRPAEPRPAEARPAEARPVEARRVEDRPQQQHAAAEARPPEAHTPPPRPAEPKPPESRTERGHPAPEARRP